MLNLNELQYLFNNVLIYIELEMLKFYSKIRFLTSLL